MKQKKMKFKILSALLNAAIVGAMAFSAVPVQAFDMGIPIMPVPETGQETAEDTWQFIEEDDEVEDDTTIDESEAEGSQTSEKTLEQLIEEELRKIEQNYNPNIAPIIFTTGTVESKNFTVIGEGIADSDLGNWSFIARGQTFYSNGKMTDAGLAIFPKFEGVTLRNVTMDDVPVLQIGLLRINDPTTKEELEFVYYLTTTHSNQEMEENGNTYNPDRISATLLPEGKTFHLNYFAEEYEIEYEVLVDGQATSDKDFDLDSVFGSARPMNTYNRAFSFDVMIKGGYIAKVYATEVDENGNTVKKEQLPTTNGFDLGEDPVYPLSGATSILPEENGPQSLVLNDTFFVENVESNLRVTVELESKGVPVFDMRNWLMSENAKGRGTWAIDEYQYDTKAGSGNLANHVSANWNWGDLENKTQSMDFQSNGTYSYKLVFQTNASESYLLNTLEINGAQLNLPFSPKEVGAFNENGVLISGTDSVFSKEIADPNNCSATTVLYDGTIVKVTYVRVFKSANARDQRVYKVEIENATSNMTITGGNLFMSFGGDPEYSTYSFIGVHADKENSGSQQPMIQRLEDGSLDIDENWLNTEMSSVFIGTRSKLVSESLYNIRFKLADGYEKPTYKLTDQNMNIITSNEVTKMEATEVVPYQHLEKYDQSKIYGPDVDGWYYVRIAPFNTDQYRFALLFIEAKPIQYVLRYDQGEIESADGMPRYTNSNTPWGNIPEAAYIDDNYGQFYSVSGSSKVTISGLVPSDANIGNAGGKYFYYWRLIDLNGKPVQINGKDVTIDPGQGMNLTDLIFQTEGASLINEYYPNQEIKEIRLQAYWSEQPRKFTYKVYALKKEESEDKKEFITLINTEIDFAEELQVAVNLDASVFETWLKENPGYHLAEDNEAVQWVKNNGEVIIYFEKDEEQTEPGDQDQPDLPSNPSVPETDPSDEEESGDNNVTTEGFETPDVFIKEHYAYIIGRNYQYAAPNESINRDEVVTIFFRLLTDEVRNQYWSTINDYSDVYSNVWHNNAVSTMSNMGIVQGYDDGTFRPSQAMTRAELAKVAVSFFVDGVTGTGTIPTFTDISGHWAEGYIRKAAALGLIQGYEDGTYRPDASITRAEAMSIINRLLGRKPHQSGFYDEEYQITWPDNQDKNEWYYEIVQEATNSHTHTTDLIVDGVVYESWKEALEVRDWAAFEKMWADANASSNPGNVR